MKKSLIILLAHLLITTSIFAQSPEKMSYQAVVRDGNNNLVASTAVGMQISILQGSTIGSAIYVETQSPTANSNGLVSLEIGSGTPVTGTFAAINWATGPYFIKIETDPTGGANYSITGTSQLLSVPYALHAKTAETVTGGITETDPVYSGSEAANITATDITNLSNLSGVNTGDQDISGIATNATAIGTLQAEQTIQNDAIALNTAKKGEADGTASGQMKYWNGMAWVTVKSGSEGQILSYIGNVPTWITVIGLKTVGPTDVYNPTTGKIWMDRNLGASQVATSPTDANSYGLYYQWGRGNDGHQLLTSGTTATLSSTDQPGHGNFIITGQFSTGEWLIPTNDNLWQGVSGVNNPCPSGYRIPTGAELEQERLSWSANNVLGAFGSPLKLPAAGLRNNGGGVLDLQGSHGVYWSSTVNAAIPERADYLGTINNNAVVQGTFRSVGASVRCIKD
jgi:hypothetical protein